MFWNTNGSEADREGETDVEAVKLITQQHRPAPCPSSSRWSAVCVCVHVCVEPRQFKILITRLALVHCIPLPQATLNWFGFPDSFLMFTVWAVGYLYVHSSPLVSGPCPCWGVPGGSWDCWPQPGSAGQSNTWRIRWTARWCWTAAAPETGAPAHSYCRKKRDYVWVKLHKSDTVFSFEPDRVGTERKLQRSQKLNGLSTNKTLRFKSLKRRKRLERAHETLLANPSPHTDSGCYFHMCGARTHSPSKAPVHPPSISLSSSWKQETRVSQQKNFCSVYNYSALIRRFFLNSAAWCGWKWHDQSSEREV